MEILDHGIQAANGACQSSPWWLMTVSIIFIAVSTIVFWLGSSKILDKFRKRD